MHNFMQQPMRIVRIQITYNNIYAQFHSVHRRIKWQTASVQVTAKVAKLR